MKVYKCIGYDVQSGSIQIIAGYYIEGPNGLYAFTYGDPRTINVDIEPADYSISLDEQLPFIQQIS
ncbi:hypothetical protein HPO06_22790 [Klebsiella pneumoniae]|nr:hypothetical protein [Klebsiella pneumoniae]HAT1602819.1 hypothetical protein [Raoultella ornithinolytica]HCB2727411.1 hypothetical protein [Klebsiella pneumoniae]HCD2904180.1 hypothetical protein [Klebsiella pneumoniae]